MKSIGFSQIRKIKTRNEKENHKIDFVSRDL